MNKFLIIIISFLLLTACSDYSSYAPVVNANDIDAIPKKGFYRVNAGDTLYSIAWRYGLDYLYLAKRNQIAPPYKIHKGQKIYLKGHVNLKNISKMTYQKNPIHWKKPFEREPGLPVTVWHWPAHGPILDRFSMNNRGVNIMGQLGDPIFATSSGKVVYSGRGLRAYGNLVILKHNRSYLTAYAYNSRLLVKSGDWVKAGQKIAEMGMAGNHKPMLHFEIRRNGQPVNPMDYLT